jgi:hypothetical protein
MFALGQRQTKPAIWTMSAFDPKRTWDDTEQGEIERQKIQLAEGKTKSGQKVMRG